jgi:hypothetical protein
MRGEPLFAQPAWDLTSLLTDLKAPTEGERSSVTGCPPPTSHSIRRYNASDGHHETVTVNVVG